jgi:integrase/recombinase XerD
MASQPETLTNDEVQKLLKTCLIDKLPETAELFMLKNYCMILFMLDAGLRVGEVVKLKIKDIVYRGEILSTLTIPAEYTKTRAERTLPLSDRLIFGLKCLLGKVDVSLVIEAERPFFHHIVRRKDADHVASIKIIPYSVRRVQLMLDCYSQAAFGRRIHPHMLRHTFATRLMKHLDIRGVQMALGHKQITSTQIYTHPDAESLKKAINDVNNGTLLLIS